MSTTQTSAQVPKLRFPGFKGEWRDCAFGEVASVKHGFAFDGEHFASEGDFIVLTPGNFTADGAFRYQGAKEKFYTSNEFPQEYVLRRGDLLMVMTEQAVGLIGCTLLVPEDGRLLHNQRLGLIQIHGAADAEYLHRYFKTERMRVALSKTGAGTKVRHTSPKRIEGLQINLPTLPEQQKIAAFLTAVDGRIEQLSRKKALLEATKKGVMQQLFTQTLRFQNDHGHDFPDWEEKTLGELCTKVGSGKTPKGGEQVYQTFGVKFIRSQNVAENRLDLSCITFVSEAINTEMKGTEVKPLDVLLNITGASIGRSCVVPSSFDRGNVNQHVCIIRPEKTSLDPIFLQLFLSSHFGQKLIEQGQSGSGREGLNFQSIRSFAIPLPSLPEQTKIAGFLSALDGKIGAVGEQMRRTQAWKKGLLQQMFV